MVNSSLLNSSFSHSRIFNFMNDFCNYISNLFTALLVFATKRVKYVTILMLNNPICFLIIYCFSNLLATCLKCYKVHVDVIFLVSIEDFKLIKLTNKFLKR